MTDEPPRLTWRNVSTHNLRDFEGYDGERLVARTLQEPNGNHDWRWSVFAICPAIPGVIRATRLTSVAWTVVRKLRTFDS